MLTKVIVVIISQYRQVSNRYVVHLGQIQCYIYYISIKLVVEEMLRTPSAQTTHQQRVAYNYWL